VQRNLEFLLRQGQNVPVKYEDEWGYGDVRTWTAIDADSKLIPSWLVGKRGNSDCYTFLADIKSRLRARANRTLHRWPGVLFSYFPLKKS